MQVTTKAADPPPLHRLFNKLSRQRRVSKGTRRRKQLKASNLFIATSVESSVRITGVLGSCESARRATLRDPLASGQNGLAMLARARLDFY